MIKDKKTAVKEKYAGIANSRNYCSCNNSCCSDSPNSKEEITQLFGYSSNEVKNIPDSSNLLLGCGNPNAIAKLKKGEVVLDLGSGGGLDCLLAGKAVGDTGYVIGVDMTPEMISLARENLSKTNYENIEFRLGEIENLPVRDNMIDVIISNCVINLSTDKQRLFEEAFRVMKPGGRLAIFDIIACSQITEHVGSNFNGSINCTEGALTKMEFEDILKNAGFIEISIIEFEGNRNFINKWSENIQFENYFVSAEIKAIKTGEK